MMTRDEMAHWLGNLTNEETAVLAEMALGDLPDTDAAEVIVSVCLNDDTIHGEVISQLEEKDSA